MDLELTFISGIIIFQLNILYKSNINLHMCVEKWLIQKMFSKIRPEELSKKVGKLEIWHKIFSYQQKGKKKIWSFRLIEV